MRQFYTQFLRVNTAMPMITITLILSHLKTFNIGNGQAVAFFEELVYEPHNSYRALKAIVYDVASTSTGSGYIQSN